MLITVTVIADGSGRRARAGAGSSFDETDGDLPQRFGLNLPSAPLEVVRPMAPPLFSFTPPAREAQSMATRGHPTKLVTHLPMESNAAIAVVTGLAVGPALAMWEFFGRWQRREVGAIGRRGRPPHDAREARINGRRVAVTVFVCSLFFGGGVRLTARGLDRNAEPCERFGSPPSGCS